MMLGWGWSEGGKGGIDASFVYGREGRGVEGGGAWWGLIPGLFRWVETGICGIVCCNAWADWVLVKSGWLTYIKI